MTIAPVPLVMGANRRPTGLRAIYAYYRVGAGVVVDNAVGLLKTR
jgi:predicted phage gp36 major capsid-like protein